MQNTVSTEQNFLGTQQQKWSDIYRRKPVREPSVDADVAVPFAQAIGLGLLSAMALFFPFLLIANVHVAVTSGVLAFSSVSVLYAWFAISEARATVYQVEEYSAETNARSARKHDTIKIEVIENPYPTGGGLAVGGRIVYEQLDVSYDELVMACAVDELSKRQLMQRGLSETTAMQLLRRLLDYGYATREYRNQPARWTAKGNALRRALVGGGGGGGEGRTNIIHQ